MENVQLTGEMIVVLALLGFTVFMFVAEVLRVDLVAILVLVIIGILGQLPGLESLASEGKLFSGFSSNAVMSIIAVMIIGSGLDRTGIMNKLAAVILKYGGAREIRITAIISGTVGIVSSFMQNVGAAALMMPVASRISVRSGFPLSRLLMPLGFCAILGGTVTMVGSSPLILLNDLILHSNGDLPESHRIRTFDLFDVTPVGLTLVATGIVYFALFGRWVLPSAPKRDAAAAGQSMAEYLKATYKLKADLVEVIVPAGNILVGQTIDDIMNAHHLYIVGTQYAGQKVIAPRLDTEILTPCRLAILGRKKVIEQICDIYGLKVLPRLDVFTEDFSPVRAGVAEIVVPPGSAVIGKTARDLRLRGSFGMSLLAIHRAADTMSLVETEDHHAVRIGKVPLQAGDTLVVHTPWDMLIRLKSNRDFVIVTSDFPQDDLRPKKVGWAVLFFAVALGLILFTDMRVSLCLMTGAVGMIIARVLTMDEAYRAVSWSTVFLLASLIPLGAAVQNTGTAAWIAQHVIALLEGWPVWSLQAGVAVLATAFSLVMSNVGATVLLVPLAISIALATGGDPALFALTVAISTSNSFIIPTHQVNALIMGTAGYRVVDFLRAGGVMTVLFLVVSQAMIHLVF
ncbi:MAG: SLC13 family permease [Rhodobacteraceae bacterium]|nr:SLC13 family permease [Paracoccaceae bacterium]